MRLLGRAIVAALRSPSLPLSPAIGDEPLPAGSDVDWDQALAIALRVRDTERERLTQIEAKIAPIIAGTLAALGLFIDKAASRYDDIAGALLLVPLAMLFAAFLTFDYDDVPNLDELSRTYEYYPKTFTKSVVLAAAEVVAKNAPRIDAKAKLLNRAMAVLYGSIVIILAVRLGEAVHTAEPSAGRTPNPAVTAHACGRQAPCASARALGRATSPRRKMPAISTRERTPK